MTIARGQLATVAKLASGTSIAAVWAVNPAAGSKVLVAFGSDNTPTAVSDNGTTPATWVLDGVVASFIYIYRADGITLPSSGQFTVTATLPSGSSAAASGCSYTGAATGGPAAAAATGTGTSAAPAGGNVTPPAVGSLAFGAFSTYGTTTNTITLTTSGASVVGNQTDGTCLVSGSADHIVTTTAAQNLAWTVSESAQWGAVDLVYAAAAGVAAPNLVKVGIV